MEGIGDVARQVSAEYANHIHFARQRERGRQSYRHLRQSIGGDGAQSLCRGATAIFDFRQAKNQIRIAGQRLAGRFKAVEVPSQWSRPRRSDPRPLAAAHR